MNNMTLLTQDILKEYDFTEIKIDSSHKDFIERIIKTKNGFTLSYFLEIEGEEDELPNLTDKNGWIEIETKEELDAFLAKTRRQVLDSLSEEFWHFVREDYV